MLDATINTDETHLGHDNKTQLVLRWLFPDPSRPVLPILSAFSIGRDPSCLMQLEGEGVSRVHAEVRRAGDGYVLRDNGSTNGTHLGGRPIEEERIHPGAVLRVGCWVGVFELRAASALGPSPFDVGVGMLGGAALREAMEPARRAAASNLPIIVCGETGTGKEVAARAIHDWSGRGGEFCAINCAALPEHLVEGELFGYRKGAFTGAERNSLGHFRRAHLGTLLLDEINELPLATQAKLLRVLQERELVPLGESTPIAIDVRVIVAAQAPLGAAVAAGRFREDLYMRLRGLEIPLPPLRARVADIPGLFQSFLAKHASGPLPALEPKLIETLCVFAWPGNVRELELIARRLLAVHGTEPVLKRRFLPEQLTEPPSGLQGSGPQGTAPAAVSTLRGPLDPARLATALRRAEGNLSRACTELQISRQRAYRLLDGVSVQDFLAKNPESS